jgi:hypothetical protein
MDFYDKLNSITHGSVLTEDIKEDGEWVKQFIFMEFKQ